MLLDRFPELEEDIDNDILEKTIEAREDSNISKILFSKNPYENIKDPDKLLERILKEIKWKDLKEKTTTWRFQNLLH